MRSVLWSKASHITRDEVRVRRMIPPCVRVPAVDTLWQPEESGAENTDQLLRRTSFPTQAHATLSGQWSGENGNDTIAM